MNNSETTLVQAVISFMEHQLEYIKSLAAIDYLRERISYFATRCEGLNPANKGGLSQSEIAELYIISNEYCNALEAHHQSCHRANPNWLYYVATASQIKDRLETMRHD